MYRKVFDTDMIQRLSDGAFIPIDVDNKDYIEFLKLGQPLLEAVIPQWVNEETKNKK